MFGGEPTEHAPIPVVPQCDDDDDDCVLLSREQRGILMSLALYTPFRRFERKLVADFWRQMDIEKLRLLVLERTGMNMHLFERKTDDCFIVSFSMDATLRFYVAMAFRPESAKDGRELLLGKSGPYRTYFFTCTCK